MILPLRVAFLIHTCYIPCTLGIQGCVSVQLCDMYLWQEAIRKLEQRVLKKKGNAKADRQHALSKIGSQIIGYWSRCEEKKIEEIAILAENRIEDVTERGLNTVTFSLKKSLPECINISTT